MRRILLTPADRLKVNGALGLWESGSIRRTELERFAQGSGVDARGVYTMVLHLDTLHRLGDRTPLIWKGGTAIQSLLPFDVQRVSTDLDFNSTTGNVEVLRETFEACNDHLVGSGQVITVQGIDFGRFYEAYHQPERQVIEFRRLLPTPFDETVELKAKALPGQTSAVRIQARLSRVQINYRQHALAAIAPEKVEVRFFVGEGFPPQEPVSFTRGSAEDLIADKVLATTDRGGFGWRRFKDLYDLIALCHLGGADLAKVIEKLDLIGGPGSARGFVSGSLETLRILSVERAAAQGFKGTVCMGGKAWVKDWERELEATSRWLMRMID